MKKIILILALSLAGSLSVAQTMGRSAYFLDNTLQRHQLNPAYGSAKKYFSLGPGNINIGIQSDLGLGTFLYPDGNGGLDLFLSDKVSAADFMSNIKDINSLNIDFNASIISMGFKGKKRDRFSSFDISLRSITGINLPGDLFSFLKEKKEDSLYDLSNIGFKNQEILQAAFGTSFNISDKIRAGYKLKGLIGMLQMGTNIERLRVKLSGSEWLVDAKGELVGSMKMLSIPTKVEGTSTDIVDWSNVKFNTKEIAPTGFGVALDLGVTYKPVNFIVLSVSVLDLGAINWNKDFCGTLEGSWSYKGLQNVSLTGTSGGDSMEEQMNEAMKELEEVFRIHKKDYAEKAFEGLPVTINGGAQIYVPGTGLSAGALYTRRFGALYSWEEYRASANFALGKWLGVSGSYAFSTFGPSFGGALNLNLPGLAFALSVDSIPTKLSKQFIPVSTMILNLNFGLCLAF